MYLNITVSSSYYFCPIPCVYTANRNPKRGRNFFSNALCGCNGSSGGRSSDRLGCNGSSGSGSSSGRSGSNGRGSGGGSSSALSLNSGDFRSRHVPEGLKFCWANLCTKPVGKVRQSTGVRLSTHLRQIHLPHCFVYWGGAVIVITICPIHIPQSLATIFQNIHIAVFIFSVWLLLITPFWVSL